jgi:uncharacterized membrane protein HdeD (DUF308 family)
VSVIQQRMAAVLSRNWWILLLRGLAAIAFGVLTWMRPGISLAALVILFAGLALADGVLGIWMALAGRKENEDWWVLLLAGLVGLGVGILTLVAPGITALALLFYIALWAIAKGVLEIVVAIRLRREIEGEWMLVLAGLASIGFGVLLLARPGAGALAILWLLAAYAVVFGVLLVLLAFRVRGLAGRISAA